MNAAHLPARDDPALPTRLTSERRHAERMERSPDWIGKRVGTPEEVARFKETLAFSARQMAELRKRNEQLMGVNSDLRYKLGEMTLRWVDCCFRNRH